jgi:hypothetical protein
MYDFIGMLWVALGRLARAEKREERVLEVHLH